MNINKLLTEAGYHIYTPKMHFLVNYLAEILMIVSMVPTWTIGHERKFNFFKKSPLTSLTIKECFFKFV